MNRRHAIKKNSFEFNHILLKNFKNNSEKKREAFEAFKSIKQKTCYTTLDKKLFELIDQQLLKQFKQKLREEDQNLNNFDLPSPIYVECPTHHNLFS